MKFKYQQKFEVIIDSNNQISVEGVTAKLLKPFAGGEDMITVYEYASQGRESGVREALEGLVHLHLCEQEGLLSGKPTPEMWFEAVNKASEALK